MPYNIPTHRSTQPNALLSILLLLATACGPDTQSKGEPCTLAEDNCEGECRSCGPQRSGICWDESSEPTDDACAAAIPYVLYGARCESGAECEYTCRRCSEYDFSVCTADPFAGSADCDRAANPSSGSGGAGGAAGGAGGTGGAGGSGGMSIADAGTDAGPVEDPGPALPPCLAIDRTRIRVVPPAGLEVAFRVLDCAGNAIEPLSMENVTVINDATGEDFNASTEGGSASPVRSSSAVAQYSVLILDLSNSIVNNGRLPQLIAGARSFVDQVVAQVDQPALRHHVAILGFGSTAQTEVLQSFTQDAALLGTALDQLESETGRGTTNLYGAYQDGLALLATQGPADAIVERFAVLITDGTHEAGDEENLRTQALNTKHTTPATIFTLGVQGDYDACRLEELAGRGGIATSACEQGGCNSGITCNEFVSVEDIDELASIFETVSQRALAIASSNYAVGVCTPIELGQPTLTLRVHVGPIGGGVSAQASLAYSTADLDGDVNTCNASMASAIAEGPLTCQGSGADAVCTLGCGTFDGGCTP